MCCTKRNFRQKEQGGAEFTLLMVFVQPCGPYYSQAGIQKMGIQKFSVRFSCLKAMVGKVHSANGVCPAWRPLVWWESQTLTLFSKNNDGKSQSVRWEPLIIVVIGCLDWHVCGKKTHIWEDLWVQHLIKIPTWEWKVHCTNGVCADWRPSWSGGNSKVSGQISFLCKNKLVVYYY